MGGGTSEGLQAHWQARAPGDAESMSSNVASLYFCFKEAQAVSKVESERRLRGYTRAHKHVGIRRTTPHPWSHRHRATALLEPGAAAVLIELRRPRRGTLPS
eukprot:3838945-Pleurochrysis_carterae.AAC.1